MNFTEDEINEFKGIYEQEYGVCVTGDEALEILNRLTRLFRFLLEQSE
jgi:hypothetical protein